MAVDVDTPDAKIDEPATDQPNEQPRDDGEADDDRPTVVIGADANRGVRFAITMGLVFLVAVSGLAGWLGYQGYQSHRAQQQRNLLIQVARQGALNLTTINYAQADADVARILDSSTGIFRDDFQKRAAAFIDVVKRAQSKSEGSITEAGLESQDGDQAQVLVAVSVNTSLAGAPEQQPRAWRMRVTVQKVGEATKVANVEFVP